MKRSWIFGSLLVVFTLAASVWSYRISLNRQEPVIAVGQPASVTTNPFNLTGFTKEAKLRVYLLSWDNLKFKFNLSGTNYNYTTTAGNHFDTAFTVKPGDTVNLTVTTNSGVNLYGWTVPTDPATRYCKGITDPVVAAAQAAGETVVSVECWNDDNAGDDPYDDFELVITQIAAAAASPSPSPSASPSPEASPSPSASAGPSPSPSASPSPAPSQPDTGTPTGLTLGLLAVIATVTIIKLIPNVKT